MFGDGYKKIDALRNQIENLSRAVRGEEALIIDSTDAIASVEVVEAAYESLQRDHWVSGPKRLLGKRSPIDPF